jgi:hypothetical protein
MASNIKFALYDFNGTPKEFYFVDEVEVPKPVLEPTVSHHIVVVDRSGSMYCAMKDTRAMVEKVMVAEEFTNSELLLTLISYSSKGDFTTHLSRKKVSEVLDPNNGFVDQIRSMQATCLTSVSGALTEALNYVQAAETTAVSIHTDGYFNDASPAAEAKLVDKWIKTVQKDFPNVYANTIAYGSWSDFKMLDRISQSLSGKTVVAKSVKQVYDALHDTTAVLAGRVLPAIHVSKDDSDFLAVHNVTQKKVNGNTVDFAVKGVGEEDVTKLYRFKKVTEERWKKERVETIGSDATPVYVFARSLLAAGRLNDAKYALCGTGDTTLLKRHFKALTSEALATFADDLDKRIAGDFSGLFSATDKGLSSKAGSVAELCQVLERHRKDFTLNLSDTLDGYKRRSVKRLAGEWVNGTFVPSSSRLQATDDASAVSVSSFDINNSSATINMQVMRKADLFKDGSQVSTVAGKKLDLREIRAYTIVGDGEVNLSRLVLNISSKKLHAELVKGGWLAEADFDHKLVYTIDLTELAAVPFSQGVSFPTEDTFTWLTARIVQRGILSAVLGGSAKADEWTAEQLEELKSNDLSANLNYNPKTTNPYTDLTAAISAGEIDSRTSFKVTVGNGDMVSVSSLYSANEYLARRFSVKGSDPAECDKDGNLKKPKLTDIVNGAAFSLKVLSARTKLNTIDDLMFPKFEAFLSGNGFIDVTVKSSREEIAAALAEVEEDIERIYAEKLRPVAMYVGATGLIPEGWSVEVMDGEGLVSKFADIDATKKQKEDGTFLVNGNVVVGIFPEIAYFSTPKGVDAAKAISAGAEE